MSIYSSVLRATVSELARRSAFRLNSDSPTRDSPARSPSRIIYSALLRTRRHVQRRHCSLTAIEARRRLWSAVQFRSRGGKWTRAATTDDRHIFLPGHPLPLTTTTKTQELANYIKLGLILGPELGLGEGIVRYVY